MAQGLSVLARLMRQGAFEEFEQGLESTRTSPNMPALKGFTRGTLGTQGSTIGGAAHRNPDAQEDEERQVLQSPIMDAFLGRITSGD